MVGPDTTAEARAPLVGRTIAAAALSTVLGSLPVFLLGGLAVLVRRDLGFGEVQLGIAVSAFFSVAALTAVPAGWVAQRLGAWGTTVVAAGLSAISLVVMAAAPSYAVLLAGVALAGAANAHAQIGSNQALATVVPRSRQGLAFGIKQSAVPGATLLAGLALPALGLTLGWRPSLAVASLLAVAYVALAPRPARDPSLAKPKQLDRRDDAAVQALVVVATAAALGSAAATSLAAFLVESAVAVGLAPSLAGLLLAGGSALGVSMRLLVGWRADTRDGRHLIRVAAMLAVGSVGMALLATGSGPALVPGTALAFGMGWSWPGLLNFVIVRHNPSAPAVATGINQTGVFAGGATGPIVFGLLVEIWSYRVAWSAAGLALLAAALLMTQGRRMMVADRARRAAAPPPRQPGPPG